MTLTLNQLESALSREINACRTNPQQYANILEKERRAHYDGLDLNYPGTNKVLQTKEGITACEEAIRFLLGAYALPELQLSYGMCLAAQEAQQKLGPTGSTVHPNSVEQLTKYGRFEKEAIEICGFGGNDARGIVLAFLICDGDHQRTQRKILFDPQWKCMGIGAGNHNSSHEIMGIINFTSKFVDK
eukprot:TRINITY_DN4931_c0_g1_i1.p1 TRINITY_DN4931_c0_g1~~TRINITY_DN4931_c0_g1_i1.p1  ORF type:complete len:187 (-),score=39.28 TRINITY_DN4931_c0_g1_i1:50-610(-)